MFAVGYTRISTTDQSNHSLDHQARKIKEYCQANGLTLLNIFKDDGESSYTFDRPDWKALETFIKSNKQVTHLIILDHDRFSRNLAEALLKIQELQKKHNIKVLATTDSIDTDFTDPSTFILRAFKYMIAESELHGIRKRTRNGIQQGNLSGRFLNMAPYGYKNARDHLNKPILVVDEAKSEIVRLIFREYLSGKTIKETRLKAAERGFAQKGNSAIQNILTNKIYIGLISVAGKNETVKGLHAPIISEADFWAVQERISGKPNKVHKSEDVPLRGVLRCFCGKLVTAGRSKGRNEYYWYYWCKEHRNNLPAIKLHQQFDELLSSLSIDKNTIEHLRDRLSYGISQAMQERGNNLPRLQKELKQVETKIASTERKYLTQPDISQATYNSVISELRAQQVRLQTEIAESTTNFQVYHDRMNALISKLVNVKAAYDEMDIISKHRFINAVFKRNLYYYGGTFRTAGLNEFFEDKALILNEKGLLKIEQPSISLADFPLRAPGGTLFEQLNELAAVFVA